MFRLETNLGGVDEAGAISPDLDWAGMVAAEFPAQRVQVRYLHPEGLEGAKGSYEVGIRGPGRPGGGSGPDLKRDMEAFGRLVEGGGDDPGRGGPEADHPGRG